MGQWAKVVMTYSLRTNYPSAIPLMLMLYYNYMALCMKVPYVIAQFGYW